MFFALTDDVKNMSFLLVRLGEYDIGRTLQTTLETFQTVILNNKSIIWPILVSYYYQLLININRVHNILKLNIEKSLYNLEQLYNNLLRIKCACCVKSFECFKKIIV